MHGMSEPYYSSGAGQYFPKIIYTFLGGILILLLIVYSIIRRLVRPLEKFSESAREIATGRFDVTLPLVRSNDEIKDLYDSLVYMQKSLSTYVNELKETTASKERIESELSIAREIQMGMLLKYFLLIQIVMMWICMPYCIPPKRWVATFMISIWTAIISIS